MMRAWDIRRAETGVAAKRNASSLFTHSLTHTLALITRPAEGVWVPRRHGFWIWMFSFPDDWRPVVPPASAATPTPPGTPSPDGHSMETRDVG